MLNPEIVEGRTQALEVRQPGVWSSLPGWSWMDPTIYSTQGSTTQRLGENQRAVQTQGHKYTETEGVVRQQSHEGNGGKGENGRTLRGGSEVCVTWTVAGRTVFSLQSGCRATGQGADSGVLANSLLLLHVQLNPGAELKPNPVARLTVQWTGSPMTRDCHPAASSSAP